MANGRIGVNTLIAVGVLVVLGVPLDAKAQNGRFTGPWAGASVVARADANTLVAGARAALERGDLVAAEALAIQAEMTPRGLLTQIKGLWSDTPAKVRRDIEAAKTSKPVTEVPSAAAPSPLPMVTDRAPEPAPKRLAVLQDEFLGLHGKAAARPTWQPTQATQSVQKPPSPLKPSPKQPPQPPRPLFLTSSESRPLGAPAIGRSADPAVALLRKSSEAFLAGAMADARAYALRAHKLRTEPALREESLLVLAHLRQQAQEKAAPAVTVVATAPPKVDKPNVASPATFEVVHGSVTTPAADIGRWADTDEMSGRDDQMEAKERTAAFLRPSLVAGPSGRWLILLGVAALLAIIVLGRLPPPKSPNQPSSPLS